MSTPTPGPWRIQAQSPNRGGTEIWGGDSPVAALYQEVGYDELGDVEPFPNTTANACLIAAAPDLYEALKACAFLIEAYDGLDSPEFKQAMAAIAKAEGNAPYNLHRIAWELERTAKGDGYYGNALRVAKDLPGATADDRALLDRYATGRNQGTDHVTLQDLALKIDKQAKAEGKG